jgi:hypothetical protein
MTPVIQFGLATAALAITFVATPALAGPYDGNPKYGPRCYSEQGGKRVRIPCPEAGFGSRTPVTLPPDRHRSAGTDTGIPVRFGAGLMIPSLNSLSPPHYFRPR